MDKNTFIIYTMRLCRAVTNTLKAEHFFGCDIGTNGFIGELTDGYGDLLLAGAFGPNITDEIFDNFWNMLYNDEEVDYETVEAFYEKYHKA